MVPELIEGESIGVVLWLFGIFLIGGKEIVAFLEVFDSVVLFESTDGAHLANGFSLGLSFESRPVSLEPGLVDLDVSLLTPARFVVCAGGEVEEGGGVLPRDRLAGGLLQ